MFYEVVCSSSRGIVASPDADGIEWRFKQIGEEVVSIKPIDGKSVDTATREWNAIVRQGKDEGGIKKWKERCGPGVAGCVYLNLKEITKSRDALKFIDKTIGVHGTNEEGVYLL